ncbi:MAG: hypothetical protein IKK75_11505, partial [Clostridia bacterium]|nr:hypothetical protein [Clostridia bacterium]
MRHLLDIRDLSLDEIDALLDRAEDIIDNPKKYSECMHGKKLATLFFEQVSAFISVLASAKTTIPTSSRP